MYIFLVDKQGFVSGLQLTAPELVAASIYPGAAASLKVDVYSYGVILEEIVLRAGPFHNFTPTMSNKGQWLASQFNLNNNVKKKALKNNLFGTGCYEINK